MNISDLWVNGLITLAVCATGGIFVCVMFALGLKSGFKHQKKGKKE